MRYATNRKFLSAFNNRPKPTSLAALLRPLDFKPNVVAAAPPER